MEPAGEKQEDWPKPMSVRLGQDRFAGSDQIDSPVSVTCNGVVSEQDRSSEGARTAGRDAEPCMIDD